MFYHFQFSSYIRLWNESTCHKKHVNITDRISREKNKLNTSHLMVGNLRCPICTLSNVYVITTNATYWQYTIYSMSQMREFQQSFSTSEIKLGRVLNESFGFQRNYFCQLETCMSETSNRQLYEWNVCNSVGLKLHISSLTF